MSQTVRGESRRTEEAKQEQQQQQHALSSSITRRASLASIAPAPAASSAASDPYSSPGCSVEEPRSDRYTPEFLRSLTPRSLRACAEEGVLPEELEYCSLEQFSGAAVAESTKGVIAAVPDVAEAAASVHSAQAAASNVAAHAAQAAAAIQHLRWKDWESARVVALSRVRITRRRNISGLRCTLFGIEKTKDGAAKPIALPALPSLPSQGNGNSHTTGESKSARSHTARPSHPHHSLPAHPSHRQLQEHAFFLSHPMHERFASDNTNSSRSLAKLEWAGSGGNHSTHAHGPDGLCLRMRDHLIREREREEWEKLEAKKEARRQRKQAQLENQWYQQRKAEAAAGAANGNGNGSQSARSAEDHHHHPRSTRAEMLRSSGAASLAATQQQQQQHQHQSAAIPSRASTQPLHSESKATLGLHSLSHSSSLANSAAHTAAVLSASDPRSAEHAGLIKRQAMSVAITAAKYAAFFENSAARIASKHEQEIARLAQLEAQRIAAAKKADAIARKKSERARIEKLRREAEAAASQSVREMKFARVAEEEQARVARLEAEWDAKQRANEARRLARAQAIAAFTAEKQSAEELSETLRREKLDQMYSARQAELERNLANLEAAFEASRARLVAQQKIALEARKEASARQRAAGALAAAQRAHDACEAKVKAAQKRREDHERAVAAAGSHQSRATLSTAELAALRSERREAKDASRGRIVDQAVSESDARVAALVAKDVADSQRVAAASAVRAQNHLVLLESKRLEDQRRARNLEREARRKAWAAQQLAQKVAGDTARLEAIASIKLEYASKREAFVKRSFVAAEAFQAEYAKLRSAGALAKMQREARRKQKEAERDEEEERERLEA